MNSIDLIIMAGQNLWRRKLRTFLTILGVMIGTSSIVIMLSLGFGMSKSLEDQVASWGSLTTINVFQGMGGQAGQGGKSGKLDKNAVQSFKKIHHVKSVNASKENYGKIINGRNESSSQIIGIDPNIMEDFGFNIAEGRLLNSSDKMSLVFGGAMSENFFNPKSRNYQPAQVNLMKDKMKLEIGDDYGDSPNKKPKKQYSFKTVGILSPDDYETSYSVYMPLGQLEKLIAENTGDKRDRQSSDYSSIKIKVEDMDKVEAVQNQVKELGYEAYSLTDELNSVKKQSLVVKAILGGIGAISLLVAAIGITNTMIMSIYERTKEIGIMKVIGASIQDIKRLFLLEAGLIGFLGGLIGLAFSFIVSILLNTVASGFISGMGMGGMESSKISIIPFYLALGALIFSILIGLASGYFPAKRAMNLSAIEAIRSE